MKTDLPLTLEQIPYTFSRCFQSDCPQADTCAHFLASKFIIKGQVSGPAIYPTSRLNGTCVCYKQTGIIHAAYGFKALFAEIKKKNEKPIRDRIKKYLGVGPLDHIRNVRLQKAAMLLGQKRFTVSEICYMTGFKSPSYFAKCFQEKFGVKPSQYKSDDKIDI